MRLFFRAVTAAFLASLVALGGPGRALAQDGDGGSDDSSDDSAQTLLKNALADMEAKRYDAACPALKRSYRKDAKPATLFYFAQCEEKAGRITTAALTYDDYLGIFDRLSPTEQKDEREHEQTASSRRQALEPQLPRVMFKLRASAPPGTKVSRVPRNADPIEVSIDVFIPIDPGDDHVVVTEAPGRARYDTRFSIKKGERKTVELDVAPPRNGEGQFQGAAPLRPVASLLPPLDPPMPPRRVAAYVLGGVGVASVIGGIVTGALVWGQKGTITDNCKGNVCNPDGESAKDLAYVSGIVSTVTFAVGGAALAGSVVLFLTEPAPPKLGGGAIDLAIKAQVSPSGAASLGLHGVW